jgi:hypothetical protein
MKDVHWRFAWLLSDGTVHLGIPYYQRPHPYIISSHRKPDLLRRLLYVVKITPKENTHVQA